jgi:hypothetical protein
MEKFMIMEEEQMEKLLKKNYPQNYYQIIIMKIQQQPLKKFQKFILEVIILLP